jgi:hypothetical protein
MVARSTTMRACVERQVLDVLGEEGALGLCEERLRYLLGEARDRTTIAEREASMLREARDLAVVAKEEANERADIAERRLEERTEADMRRRQRMPASVVRLRQLRLDDVRRRVERRRRVPLSVINDTHRLFDILGGVWWLESPANKGKHIEDYETWRTATKTLARALDWSLCRRLERVTRIARAWGLE